MDLNELAGAWPMAGPWTLRSTSWGSNNLSYYVDTPGETYILRVYQNTRDLARLRYEHAILTRLQQAGLSFAVPAPVPAATGETIVVVPQAGGEALAALFRLIPGQHPERGNSAHVQAAAAALGELDRAG